MVEIVLERLVLLWHLGTWCKWEGQDDGDDPRPVAKARYKGNGQDGVWITMDKSCLFGPAGNNEQPADYILPPFVRSKVAVKQTQNGTELCAKDIVNGHYWQFGFDGQLVTRRKPLAAHAWQLGCATFMAVLTDQFKPQLEAMATVLGDFFSRRYEEHMLRIMGVPRCLSVETTLQLTGRNGTYLVPMAPEVVLGRGHFGEVRRGVDNASQDIYAVRILAGVVEGTSEDRMAIVKEARNARLMEFLKHVRCSLILLTNTPPYRVKYYETG